MKHHYYHITHIITESSYQFSSIQFNFISLNPHKWQYEVIIIIIKKKKKKKKKKQKQKKKTLTMRALKQAKHNYLTYDKWRSTTQNNLYLKKFRPHACDASQEGQSSHQMPK